MSAVQKRAELPHVWTLKAKEALEAAKLTDEPSEKQEILAIADAWMALAQRAAHGVLRQGASEMAAND